jgi:hypothetical protein
MPIIAQNSMPNNSQSDILILQIFSGPVIPQGVDNGPPASCAEPSALEERVGAQGFAIDLKPAVLACFSWTPFPRRDGRPTDLSARKTSGCPVRGPLVNGGAERTALSRSLLKRVET